MARYPKPKPRGQSPEVFTYSYDSYKRLTQIMVGSTPLRTFMYDTNTLDGTFSGQYTAGRLVAVQNLAFTPQGFSLSNISIPSTMRLVEMYRLHAGGSDFGQAVAGAGDSVHHGQRRRALYAADAEHGHSLHVQ